MRSITIIFFFACICSALAVALWLQRSNRAQEESLSSDTNPDTEPSPVLVLDPEHPCGPVCVSLVTHFFGAPVDLAHVKMVVPTDPLGHTSMAEMCQSLRSLGFAPVGVKLNADALHSLPRRPLILFVKNSHFVTALSIGGGSLIVVDPPYMPTEKNANALSLEWKGEAILIAKSETELEQDLRELKVKAH